MPTARNLVQADFKHPYGNPNTMSRGDMVNACMDAQEKARQARQEADYWRAQLKGRCQVGAHKGFTVYRVSETQVSAYTRGAYRALRLTTRD